MAARYKDELDALATKGQQQESSSAPGNDQSDERIRQLEASVETKEAQLLQLKVNYFYDSFASYFDVALHGYFIHVFPVCAHTHAI